MRGNVIVIVIVAAVLGAPRVGAQIAGHVVSLGGEPVPSARVELWSPTARVAQQVTGADGAFRFIPAQTGTAVAILVRRIGFSPLRVPIPVESQDLVLRLKPLAQTLAEVTVTAAEDLCPNVESADARAMWTRLQQRYDAGDGLSRGTTTLQFNGRISKDSIGEPDRSRLFRGDRATSATGIAYFQLEIVRLGYVWPSPASGGDPDYGIWTYPVLDADYVQHFVEPMFAQRHAFSVMRDADEETQLVFCPIDRKRSGLEGALRIAPDGSPVSVRWRFYNPEKQAEDAGGEVTFAPRDERAAHPILLAASGVFWRKLKHGDYWERWEEFDAWKVEPGDSMLMRRP